VGGPWHGGGFARRDPWPRSLPSRISIVDTHIPP
jgi:hypothetical protein